MPRYHGKRVSAPWLTILRAYERDRKRPVPVNDGRRTMAEQVQRVRDHGLWSPANPTGAAAPSPTAPHIRVGRQDHALDINHPQNLDFIAWCAERGLEVRRPIAAEPWHCEAASEAALLACAKRLRPTRRERLTAELATIRATVKRIGHWTPKRRARADAIKKALGIKPKPERKPPIKATENVVYAARARRAGARYALTIIREAKAAGVQLSLAFALVEQETGFTNVFGHDRTVYAGAGKVTKRKYLEYKRQRGPSGRGGMQGVGPCQLTWWSTQDAADKEGGCWKPRANIRVGLRTLAQNIRAHGEFAGVAAYNGSGQAAQNYARSVLAKRDRWHTILTGGAR